MEAAVRLHKLNASKHRNRLATLQNRSWTLFVLFYALFANIPFWAASHWLGLLPIGWICVEYACLGLLALAIPGAAASILLLLLISADILNAVSKTYYLSPTECLVNSPYLHNFSGARLWSLVSVIVLAILTAALPLLLPIKNMQRPGRLAAAMSLVALIALALAVDYASVIRETGHLLNPFHALRPSDLNRFSNFRTLWVGRYPLARLGRDQTLFSTVRNGSRTTLEASPSVPSAAAQAMRFGGLDAKRPAAEMYNLVLILVESWGLDLDPSVRNSLLTPYFQPKVLAQYHVLQGTVPFYGSTVAGEARELCSSRIGLQIVNVPAQGLRDCLPYRMNSWGYHSVALHGMDGLVFSRSEWYRTIGFQEVFFRDSFRKQAMPECVGAFVGTCDAAVAGLIEQRLRTKTEHPDFVYWVTLNSHLPVPTPSGLESGASCSFNPALSTHTALCSWYQLVSNVHDSTAQLAAAQLGRPTVFAIVGDHAPPFANPEIRDQFSSEEVPYLLLIPR